jgi:hypothetical protein
MLLDKGIISAKQQGDAILGAAIKAQEASKTMQGGLNAGILQLNKDWSDSSALMKSFVTGTGSQLASTLTDIASGTVSAKDGFRAFGEQVLKSAQEMIIKMLILGPLMRGLSSALGLPTGVGATGAVKAHSGGVVTGYGARGSIDPIMFAGARRFHSGGLAGGEIPAILRANEEVLTPENPRHVFNGGGGSININVTGARGNMEIMDMVSAGVRQGISTYDQTLNTGGLARKMSNVRIRGQR